MLYVNSSLLLCILFGLGSLDYEAGSVEKFSTNENTLIITDFVISFSKLMSSDYQTYPDAKYVISFIRCSFRVPWEPNFQIKLYLAVALA